MAENQIVKKDFRSIVQKTADAYIPLVAEQLAGDGIHADAYQKQCMANALVMMNDVALASEKNGGSDLSALPKTDIMQIMQRVATLRLNAFSQPREVYFQTRKKKQPDGSWGISIEMGIEGDGNDAILRSFGVDVEKVYPFWPVREDDSFEYPKYRGVEVTPPSWEPGGKGKYVHVVYPVKFTDGTVRYFIGEREDVKENLIAHITNNLMNETFGITSNRYNATVGEKQQIDAKKKELLSLCDGKALDEILDIPDLAPYISPAWSGANRERMILRKMRNNTVKPIPKDFSSRLGLDTYAAATEDVIDAEYRMVNPEDLPQDHPVVIPSPAAAPDAAAAASMEHARSAQAKAPF